MGYGKSNYSTGQKFQKTGKPGKGPGDNFIRIMPAMHSLGDEGRWAVYYTTHWGYAGLSKNDPTKTVVRPFRCIEVRNFQTKMTSQSCPECDNYNAKDKEAQAFAAELKKQGLDDKAIKAHPEMKVMNDWLQAHAPERKWYINVMYRDRSFGDYKINHKTHKKGIDAKIQELLEKNDIDATDLDQGVFFNIKRLGDGFSVPDVVEVAMKPGEKRGQMEIELAPLTEEEKERGLKECRDLALLGGAVLTEEQIYALVQCDGSPEAVDKIFGERPTAPARQETEREEDEPAEAAPAAKSGPTQAELQARAAQIIAKKKAEADAAAAKKKAEEAAQRAAAAVKAAKAAEAAPAAPPAAEAAPAVDPLNMDDEAFLKFFESQQQA